MTDESKLDQPQRVQTTPGQIGLPTGHPLLIHIHIIPQLHGSLLQLSKRRIYQDEIVVPSKEKIMKSTMITCPKGSTSLMDDVNLKQAYLNPTSETAW